MSTGKMPESSKEGCLYTIQGNFWYWSLRNTAAVLQARPERPEQKEWLHVARQMSQKYGHGFLHGKVLLHVGTNLPLFK